MEHFQINLIKAKGVTKRWVKKKFEHANEQLKVVEGQIAIIQEMTMESQFQGEQLEELKNMEDRRNDLLPWEEACWRMK